MSEGCQQTILAFFGESWPPSAKPRRIENPLRDILSSIYRDLTACLPKL